MFIQVSQVMVIWLFMHDQGLNLALFRSLMYESMAESVVKSVTALG